MADANSEGVIDTAASEDANTEVVAEENNSAPSEAEARVKALEAELAKANDILAKARKGEKYAKQSKQELEARLQELEAQGDWKAKYEQLVERENTRIVDGELSKEVAKHFKPESQKLVMKALDRSALKVADGVVDAKAVEALMLKAREEFPEHAVQVETPAPKRAAEGAVTGGYATEMRAAKTPEEVEAVMRKYAVIR